MNIKIENLSYEAWDEVYYILNNKRKFIKKPNIKAKEFTAQKKSTMIYYICLLIALSLVFLVRHLKHMNTKVDIVVTIFLLTIIAYKIVTNYIIYRNIKKDINKRINADYKMTSLKINKEGTIVVKSRKNVITLLWNEISHIIINKYSIVILSKGRDKLSIVLPLKIKKKLLDKLKKEKQLELVVDNEELYIKKESIKDKLSNRKRLL